MTEDQIKAAKAAFAAKGGLVTTVKAVKPKSQAAQAQARWAANQGPAHGSARWD
jgi:hypothetical protein